MKIKPLTLIVIAAHLSCVLFVAFSSSLAFKKPQKKLVVRTVTPKQTVVAKSAPAPVAAPKAKPVAAVPKKQPPPKKEVAKPVKSTKKAPTPKKKPAPIKEPEPDISEDLLKDLQESIAKIDQKRDKIVSENKLPTPRSPKLEPMPTLASAELEEQGESYQDALIAYLHEALNLPEYGEVKIQLTLHPDGSVLRLAVLKTESEKNRSYLEKSLPHLRFPAVQGQQQTFTLTFCNEI